MLVYMIFSSYNALYGVHLTTTATRDATLAKMPGGGGVIIDSRGCLKGVVNTLPPVVFPSLCFCSVVLFVCCCCCCCRSVVCVCVPVCVSVSVCDVTSAMRISMYVCTRGL